MGVALIDADEGVHAVGPASNWNESRYVDFWDANARVGGWLRIGMRPNEQRAEVSVCVYLPDGRVAFRFDRAPIDDNGLSAGGQSWQVDEPFRRNAVQYGGPVHVLEDGWLLADPRSAYAAADEVDCELDLVLSSRGLAAVMGSDQDHIDQIFLPGQADWEQPDQPGRSTWMQTPPTRAGGFPDRAFLLRRYAELTGFDTADIGFYRGFAAWRMAVIAEGIRHRYQAGAMADSDVDHGFLAQRIVDLLAQSDRHLRAIGA